MRRPALNKAGQAHELTFCCFRGFCFLRADQTCQWLADSLDKARQKLEFLLWAYVFMPEHVHLVVYPKQPVYDIRIIRQRIKEPVGRKAVKDLRAHAPHWLPRITVQRGNRLERRSWQAGGGFDRNVIEPHTLFAMIEYIHANPVRRGLVSRAEDWRWSSAGWFEGKNSLRPDTVELGGLSLFVGRKR